jgi:hypothetical protein
VSPELPSTTQLVDAPELAALHVLEVALATAERALTAAHPDLDELLSPTQWPETAEWLADAVLVHITALETAVHRYRTHLRARGHRLRPTSF